MVRVGHVSSLGERGIVHTNTLRKLQRREKETDAEG